MPSRVSFGLLSGIPGDSCQIAVLDVALKPSRRGITRGHRVLTESPQETNQLYRIAEHVIHAESEEARPLTLKKSKEWLSGRYAMPETTVPRGHL